MTGSCHPEKAYKTGNTAHCSGKLCIVDVLSLGFAGYLCISRRAVADWLTLLSHFNVNEGHIPHR